ncbi:PAS domain S-box protein, partial [bacterium AH-315-C08]|nr:PAS domain S-box protein [bacterium AH-315-C08]
MDIKTQRSEEPLDSNSLSPERGRRYEAVINATQEGVVVIDESGIIQTFNPAAESLFGYQAEEVIGKNVSLLMPEPHRSEHDNYIQQYLRTGKSDLIGMLRELTALRKDGSSFLIELAANPVNLGTQRFFVGTVRDIGERKRAEAQRNLLHNITKLFSTSDDLEFVFPKVLQTICKFMNWEIIFCWMLDEERQVLRCSHFWHAPDNIKRFKEFVDKSMEMTFENGVGLPGRVCESSEPHWIVDVTQDTNFPRFPFALKAGLHSGFGFPVANSKGLIGVIEVFSEKTLEPKEDMAQLISSLGNQMGQFFERYELKQRLLKDQQNFFNMLENLPVSFHLQAPDYTVPFANKMFRERFGNPQEGKKCFQLMYNRSEPCKVCTPFEIFGTNDTRDSIWTALDGKTYLTVATPFQDIDGSNLVMEMAVDITKEKEAEKEKELFHQRLHKMVEGCATAYNDESFFQLLVKNLASALQVRCAFIGECLDDGAVQTHAIWLENNFIENVKYPLKDTPCEFVTGKGIYYCPQNVHEAFAKDQMLVDLKVDSYMGVPFFDVSGKRLGLLSVMHSSPIEDPEMAQMILEIFAKYAGSALERKKITDKLQRSYKDLEETNEEL